VSEQIVDLGSVWAILRRNTRALAIAAVIGALGGFAALRLLPVEYTSTSVVLLPPLSSGATALPNSHSVDTQVQIALSEAVLGRAGASLHPRLNSAQVADRIAIEAPTDEVLSITAQGRTSAEAEELASAVAAADVAYLREAGSALSKEQVAALNQRIATLKGSLTSVNTELTKTTNRLKQESATVVAGKADAAALAQLTARQADLVLQIDGVQKQLSGNGQDANGTAAGNANVIQQASPAVALPVPVRAVMFVSIGAAAMFLVAAAVIVLRGRKEKTLRSRDQIADTLGVPVVASLQSRTPRSVAGWESLLATYAPDSVEAWTLRQLLQRLTPGTPESLAVTRQATNRKPRTIGEDATRSTRVVVLVITGDLPALAFGPQLASFSAATGARTQLVVPPQPHESTNSLRAAASRLGGEVQPRPGLSVDSRPDVRYSGDLVVYVVTVDRHKPDPYLFGVDDAVTLLAVSSGAATAEDLATIALGADDVGLSIDGVVVADPDPMDRTTGRFLPTERAHLAPLPSLMTGPGSQGEPPASAARGGRLR
jgi:capsular polysaccharide biosynthesis protein